MVGEPDQSTVLQRSRITEADLSAAGWAALSAATDELATGPVLLCCPQASGQVAGWVAPGRATVLIFVSEQLRTVLQERFVAGKNRSQCEHV